MDMKKYMTPEMEVVEFKYQSALLSASDGSGSTIVPPTEPSEEPILE